MRFNRCFLVLQIVCLLLTSTPIHPVFGEGQSTKQVLDSGQTDHIPSESTTPLESKKQTTSVPDFNTMLMLATFRLEGPSSIPGKNTLGTAFLVGRPHPTLQNRFRYTLVTAAHVLNEISGEVAIIYFRRQLEHGKWQVIPTPVRIRIGGKHLWVQHAEADVAAMYIGVPEKSDVTFIPTDVLADDALLTKYDIHPGDTLDCLGYPLGVESPAGRFPILRSGKIASYPLLPTKETKSFLLDFRVFQGNSGGPVYINFMGERLLGNAIQLGTGFHFLLGLVSQEVKFTEIRQQLYSSHKEETPLGLAKIIHASFIRETVTLLPSPETE